MIAYRHLPEFTDFRRIGTAQIRFWRVRAQQDFQCIDVTTSLPQVPFVRAHNQRFVCKCAHTICVCGNASMGKENAGNIRLAVRRRLQLSPRPRYYGVCVGIPAAQFRLSARLSIHPRRSWCERRKRRAGCPALGVVLSRPIRICNRIAFRSCGCRTSIPPPFSSPRLRRRSRMRARSAS